ncbi:MAG: conjugative transfer ATPase, partial [Gammaproteobacteria bacterium]
HVIDGFNTAAANAIVPDVAKRLAEMARAMAGFIKNPMKARFFNRPSAPMKDADLTVIDLGFLQEKQNASMMSLVFISLLAKILALAEANQYSDRPTILILDEAHIPLKNPLVALFLVLMAKVARKIGLWLMPTTQNVEDFASEESKKILSMMETLICLAVGNKEIEHIKQFRPLSEEEEALLRDIRKY